MRYHSSIHRGRLDISLKSVPFDNILLNPQLRRQGQLGPFYYEYVFENSEFGGDLTEECRAFLAEQRLGLNQRTTYIVRLMSNVSYNIFLFSYFIFLI